jgi:hypothetical protein
MRFGQVKSKAIATVRKQLEKRNFLIVWAPQSDMPDEFWKLHARCREQSMTGPERLYGLYDAVRYVHARKIPGSIVECGVWRGGSSMMAALTLQQLGDTSRDLYLYDTFTGMSAPTEHDVDINGRTAESRWREGWVAASLEDVQANMRSTGYPQERITYVRGMVEETIPETIPDQIALLRLDTDFYESTAHELEHLYPRLTPGGVLIVDDYGNWQGARKAVDEYFAAEPLLFSRIDYTARQAVKA